MIDPSGKFAAQVNADRDLGKAIKLDHTPTVYIVSTREPQPALRRSEEPAASSMLTIDAIMKE